MRRPEDCLRVVLCWMHTRGSLIVLQNIFGMSMTPTSKYLQFSCWILVKVLQNDDNARISMPSHQLEDYCNHQFFHHPEERTVHIDGCKGTREGKSV